MERLSGILLPVFSLPSRFGIGCFSKEAYEWIDFLKRAGVSIWQILPLGPASFGNSPYMAYSTFAGSPLYISLEDLIDDGLLTWDECLGAGLEGFGDRVDYDRQNDARSALLKLAYERSGCKEDPAFHAFCEREAYWLCDYAFYMALKDEFGQISWQDWEAPIRMRRPDAMTHYRTLLEEKIRFYEYLQYLFFTQYDRLHAYAKEAGIKILGDMPIYLALDSSDVWTHPELFLLDETGQPSHVAGCPPDYFAKDGQKWGNPLYDWEMHRQTGYAWWLSRLAHCARMCDAVRLDHFRGFDEYYAIPAKDENARNGVWHKGPGMELFSLVQKKLPQLEIIAEDLGLMTKSVQRLVQDSGYPNMKVLQFGFNSDADNEHLPQNYIRHCVAYTGTHDNETLLSHLYHMEEYEQWHVRTYLNRPHVTNEELCDVLIRLLLASPADYAIIPLQDYLGIGDEGRINTPSTIGTNWNWRVSAYRLTDDVADYIRHLGWLYGRLKKDPDLPAYELPETAAEMMSKEKDSVEEQSQKQ